MKYQFVSLNLDFLGFSASLLCAIHCAAIPFLLSFSTLIGLQFLANPLIELLMIFISLIIASLALIHGYRKHHKKITPIIVVLAGFLLIFAGHISHHEVSEMVLVPVGATIVAIAHFINWSYIRKSNTTTCQIR